MVLRVATLVLVVGGSFAQDMPYFPNLAFEDNQQHNDFVVQWYTRHLKALQEPSLLQQASTRREAYRFLWLRTFHNPVVVRLNVDADGSSLLTVKMSNGQGGYKPGKLTKDAARRLSRQETDWFLDRVRKLDYWNLPTREKEDTIGTDGARWVIEAIKDGRYKVVDRWSPDKGAVRALALIMLLDLAKLNLPKQDVY